jgi:methylated-DNA-[protein]-cysteine S-methyltransferase
MSDVTFSLVRSVVGELLLTSDGEALTGLYPHTHRDLPDTRGLERNDAWFSGVRDQLDAYFRGKLSEFTVALAPRGTVFQQRVWAQLKTIPCGITRTYSEIAEAIGRPSASRAVGTAIGRNPISLIVPCHRVVGASGALTGYAGGLELKKWLLAHESELEGWVPMRESASLTLPR